MTGATGTVTLSLATDPGGAALNGTLTATIDRWRRHLLGTVDRRRRGRLFPAGDRRRSRLRDLERIRRGARGAGAARHRPNSPRRASRPATGFGLAVDVEDATATSRAASAAASRSPWSRSGRGRLGGDLTITASDGVADFSGLTLDQAGTGYTIQASRAA